MTPVLLYVVLVALLLNAHLVRATRKCLQETEYASVIVITSITRVPSHAKFAHLTQLKTQTTPLYAFASPEHTSRHRPILVKLCPTTLLEMKTITLLSHAIQATTTENRKKIVQNALLSVLNVAIIVLVPRVQQILATIT